MLLLRDVKRERSRSPSPVRSNDDRKVDSFFSSLIPDEYLVKEKTNVSFILVCHMAPTLFPYLAAIKKLGNIALIVPKGFQRESAKKVMEKLKAEQNNFGYEEFMKPKENNNPEEIKERIRKSGVDIISRHMKGRTRTQNKKIIIIDIGGYFSDTLEKIVLTDSPEMEALRSNILGIVEDTENGHQKYANSIEKLKKELGKLSEDKIKPSQKKLLSSLYSVARCALKNTEDYNVGKSIVEASGTIVRIDAHVILERLAVAGVIGFGKIGRSIAEHLRQKNLREVIVYDADIIRQMEASSLGFKVVSRPEIIRESQILFSATGSRCLKAEDIMYMQDNVFIASCTSSEDELDFSFRNLLRQEQGRKKQGDIYKVKVGDKSVNLLDDGNAVNFLHGAVNGPYIYSVQGGLIVSAINLIRLRDRKSPDLSIAGLKELSREGMQEIAEKWLTAFDRCDSHIDFHLETYLLEQRQIPYDGEHFGLLLNYLEENRYFVSLEFKETIENIQKILNGKTEPTLATVADSIREFLEKGMFASLFGYLDNLLLKKVMNYPANYEKSERLNLYLLRATADLYLSANSKESWSKLGINHTLNESFSELNLTIQSQEQEMDLGAKRKCLPFLTVFLDTIDSIGKQRVKSKMESVVIDRFDNLAKQWSREVEAQNKPK